MFWDPSHRGSLCPSCSPSGLPSSLRCGASRSFLLTGGTDSLFTVNPITLESNKRTTTKKNPTQFGPGASCFCVVSLTPIVLLLCCVCCWQRWKTVFSRYHACHCIWDADVRTSAGEPERTAPTSPGWPKKRLSPCWLYKTLIQNFTCHSLSLIVFIWLIFEFVHILHFVCFNVFFYYILILLINIGKKKNQHLATEFEGVVSFWQFPYMFWVCNYGWHLAHPEHWRQIIKRSIINDRQFPLDYADNYCKRAWYDSDSYMRVNCCWCRCLHRDHLL